MDRGKLDGAQVPPLQQGAPPRRRAATLLTVVAVHALGLLALLHLAPPPPGSPVGTLSVFSLAPPSNAATKPETAAKPEKPRPRSKDGDRNAPEAVPAAAAPSTRGETCDPLEAVELALIDDKAAQAALDALPTEAMGIANSIAVWTTGWNEGAVPPSGALLPLRAAIDSALMALPQACRDAPVLSPIFYPFSTGRRGYLLVFGSGEWRWQQLVEPPLDATTVATDQEPALLERIFAPF